MMSTRARSLLQDALVPVTRHYLDEIFAGCACREFQLRFWNGATWGAADPVFTLVIRTPDVLATLLDSPDELTLGEAYLRGDLDVEGDMESAFEAVEYLLSSTAHPQRRPFLVSAFGKRIESGDGHAPDGAALHGARHSKERDREAIHYHYDLPVEFYALWLDPRLVYSTAYFTDPQEELEPAQERKLEYLCRKLRLKPGESLLDIGCGWGGLVMYAAERYGARAHGVTASVRQAEEGRRRAQQAGLEDRCRIEVCDYRDIQGGPYDKIVSVGMFEHVGEALLPEYFSRAARLLRPGGVFLNHGIARSVSHHPAEATFSDRYVFPDGELVPIHVALRAAENASFEVRDVESLREHYVLTLRHWVRRLEAHAAEARRVTDDTTYRIWRLYMSACAHRFRSGRYNLYQTLLAKPQDGDSGLPLTRADWYCP